MKLYQIALIIGLSSFVLTCQKMTMKKDLPYDLYPVYEGSDLGLQYTMEASIFKVWAPSASELRLKLYAQGQGGTPLETIDMTMDTKGVWRTKIEQSLEGRYYAFQAKINGEWKAEVVDPYARAVGVNGDRGQVVDLTKTNPSGWEIDNQSKLVNPTDAIIYELHVRDVSMHPSSGIQAKGKFLGLAESDTKSPQGLKTGLAHIKELGITHVHLLPSFDFNSIDETKLEENRYNWGYDPKNYNVPEGSYSSNPTDGAVRIKEFKQMVQAFHEKGIGVILDVVYNHTGPTEDSNFNQLVPGYYYRQNQEGGFSDASACGNETASERAMMRKFMVESIEYWMKEYHLDGFRFDLMGIHDIETMNAISAAARAIDPGVLIYGEGWTAGDSPLPIAQRALKAHTHQMDHIAAFSDDMRDGLKGHVFTHDAPGFASGAKELKASVQFGIVGSIWHPQIDYPAVNYSDSAWAKHPGQTVTYVSCHDNHTLWDKLAISRKDATEETRTSMHKLALASVLTSQGISFLHAGAEMKRTKQGVENSFESPDAINSIDWNWKSEHLEVYNYVQGLIRLRKTHPAFRMMDDGKVREHLTFLDTDSDQVIAYKLEGHANGDPWATIIVVLNGSDKIQNIKVPATQYTQVVNGVNVNLKGLETFSRGNFYVAPYSAAIYHTNTVTRYR